jgi:eukaryotic-like serine/threonine-protein kinase
LPPLSERLLAGRYRLTDRAEGLDTPARIPAVEVHSGAGVALEAVPLPEVVGAELLHDGPDARDTVYGLPPEDTAPQQSAAAAHAVRSAERAAAAMPSHPRLLAVYEAFAEDGRLWVAEEQVPGVPLARLLESGPLPLFRVAEIADDVLAALCAVHAAGLVHGNVTAETVIVCEDGAAMLGGLGIGAAQEALSDSADPGSPSVGWTPARQRARDTRAALTGPCAERWAPEQVGPPPDRRPLSGVRSPGALSPGGSAHGGQVHGLSPYGVPAQGQPQPRQPLPDRQVGPAADCWAVGVLLFRALTGHGPFPEDDLPTLLDAVRTGRHASFGSCGQLSPLVAALLRRDPAERPGPALVRRRLAPLLAHAPEPHDPGAAAELLPVLRTRGTVVRRGRLGRAVEPHPDHPHGPPRHARHGSIPPALLGPLLVGGIVLALLVALALLTLLAG